MGPTFLDSGRLFHLVEYTLADLVKAMARTMRMFLMQMVLNLSKSFSPRTPKNWPNIIVVVIQYLPLCVPEAFQLKSSSHEVIKRYSYQIIKGKILFFLLSEQQYWQIINYVINRRLPDWTERNRVGLETTCTHIREQTQTTVFCSKKRSLVDIY